MQTRFSLIQSWRQTAHRYRHGFTIHEPIGAKTRSTDAASCLNDRIMRMRDAIGY
jgi:hypothetical protein